VQRYLWRAVDQDGVVLDILVQVRRDTQAAKRFFKRLLKAPQYEPPVIVTDKLRNYGVAQGQLLPGVKSSVRVRASKYSLRSTGDTFDRAACKMAITVAVRRMKQTLPEPYFRARSSATCSFARCLSHRVSSASDRRLSAERAVAISSVLVSWVCLASSSAAFAIAWLRPLTFRFLSGLLPAASTIAPILLSSVRHRRRAGGVGVELGRRRCRR
jgi:hypothetical protein